MQISIRRSWDEKNEDNIGKTLGGRKSEHIVGWSSKDP